MTRAGLLAAVVVADLLLGALPAAALPAGPTDVPVRAGPWSRPGPAPESEQQALALLQTAARAGRDLTYTGRQVLAWAGDQSGSALAQVHHDPVRGSTVASGEPLVVAAAPDRRRLVLLAAAYDLAVTAPGRCTGRTADVVSASRPDGTLAGRFWIDRGSGLLLRRDVFDRQGGRVRSGAYVDVSVGGPKGDVGSGPEQALPQASTLTALRQDGWGVPTTLPGGFRLFDTRQSSPQPGRRVLHLAYSDGLSTVSLFAQRGRLGSAPVPGFVTETVGARPVWVRRDGPERAVWGGGGRVWSLVSDAPTTSVRDIVAALPGDAAPSAGVRGRLGRGLGRLGELLNPFS